MNLPFPGPGKIVGWSLVTEDKVSDQVVLSWQEQYEGNTVGQGKESEVYSKSVNIIVWFSSYKGHDVIRDFKGNLPDIW